MKKIVLLLLCVLLFAAVAGGAWAYLYLTPRGVLRPDGPDAVMQSALDGMDRSRVRDRYVALCRPEVTEFEDAAQVAGEIFDAAVTGDSFVFRPLESSDPDHQQDYILSAGGADLLKAHLNYENGKWQVEFLRLDGIQASTRTLTVTVPEGTVLTLNGKTVGERYIVDDAVLYPDMSDLELRFASFPHLVRYVIDGIYSDVELSAERDGGLTQLYADGSTWSFTVPDAAGYAFCVSAPGDATVTVNGAQLLTGDVTAASAYDTKLDIPGELQGYLPSYSIYAAGGLYTPPEITAVMPDGTSLTPETAEDGSVFFPLPGSAALYETHHERVEQFLKALCEYGAGHTARYAPGAYAAYGTSFSRYLQNAIDSLYWTVNVTTSYDEISSGDYIPLGEAGFLCSGHVLCTTKTRYQTVDLDLHYEMIWTNVNGVWLVQDLAFA